MKPVLERSTFPNKTIEVRRRVVRNAIPERVMMCARDDGNRVDLHVAELFERAVRGVDASAERFDTRQTLRIERDTPQ